MINKFSVAILGLLCTGCAAAPPAVKIISWMKTGVDVVSYVETDKMATDHAISYVMDQDCNTFNVLDDDPICQSHNIVLALIDMITMKCDANMITDNVWMDGREPNCKEEIF